MSRRRGGFMSEELKNELAKDLGIYETVQREGWGGIKAKDAGNMVKRAIQIAEQAAAKQMEQAQKSGPTDNNGSRQTQSTQTQAHSYVQQPINQQTQPVPAYRASSVPPYMQPPTPSQQPQYRQ
ncbi:hypothetical protein Back11_46990 [Paenibacillus baekrokdamisoli]|uniref:Uncharacterized protein n=1 Tax=Paenibacillus baekrokdamisoli TaxID=1712516 RepID=A0A3G9JKA9_9BACL|nr:chemotaxis regulatin CheY-phosphate phosphatase CheZ [Paenibacillus baekrokdamisoli]BBH23354.1 hypothetical protein Back11_46990 [Paenibacillus baekrokdamisoli]